MKITNMKKKVVISGLALAMAITSTSFGMFHIYGEGEEAGKVVSKTVVEKKALYTKEGNVTGRNNDDSTDNVIMEASEYGTITDLMIDADVTSIPISKFAFLGNITTLSFKDVTTSTVASIGEYAFLGTGITSVELPKALTTIETYAFANTAALKSVNFTNSINLQEIQISAFENSGLTELDLSPIDSATSTTTTLNVGESAFKGNTNLATVTLSKKMTMIGDEVFGATNLTTVELSQGVTSVSIFAFKGTPLANLTVAAENASYMTDANILYNKEKTRLILYPEGITETTFTVPASVTHIEQYAFSSAPTLTKVSIGPYLTNIGQYAFDGASKLAEIELNDAVTHIGQYAFQGTALTSVALSGAIKTIGLNAFAGTSKLTTLDLRKAKAIKTVRQGAFQNSALTSLIIGKQTGALDEIENDAFSGTVANKLISALDDSGSVISGEDFKALMERYKHLTTPEKGSWIFDIKLPKPQAVVDYAIMKLTGLAPLTEYAIATKDYTTDAQGNLDIVQEWSGKTIEIIRKASLAQLASDPQSLVIEDVYTVNIDGIANSVRKVGTSVTITAPEKPGHVFIAWQTDDVSVDDVKQKTITFEMPAKNVNLITIYREIVIETSINDLIFDGKNDVVLSITSSLTNFEKIAVNTTELKRDREYIATGTDTTILTLKKDYLDTLTTETEFTVTFHEGGEKRFYIRLYDPAPVAVADYQEMKLTGFVANAQYKINENIITADGEGKIRIQKAWSSQTLEIIKVGGDSGMHSKPQNLNIQALYTIHVDGIEVGFTAKGTKVTLKAERKDGYKIKEWIATGVILADAKKEEIIFLMPASNVQLKTTYTEIITTKPEDMVYNGTKEVSIRFDIPMSEFLSVEYVGQTLVKDVDYTVASGSTIITFTTTCLDKMDKDMTGIKAIFLNNTATFTIRYEILVPPVHPLPPVQPAPPIQPVPPLVDDSMEPTLEPVAPPMLLVPAKPKVETTIVKNPNTGDSTTIILLFTMMVLSVGVFVVANKIRKQI